jgi:hypothetical protein
MSATLVGDLSCEENIWRYMTLDRFINILDDSALYMSSLGAYSKSDPYEGYPPPVVLNLVKEKCPPTMYFSHEASGSEDLNNFKVFAQRLFHSRVVSCWYQGDDESEAMWKLYGDAGKAIAIRTTVGGLAKALGKDFNGRIARVSYVNYTRLTQADSKAVMNAQKQNALLDPIFKRSSYAHEREVRAYMQIEGAQINDLETYRSHMAAIDCAFIIDEIVVSPFCSASYVKAVKAVARKFGFEDVVRQSSLLSDLEPLYSRIEQSIKR